MADSVAFLARHYPSLDMAKVQILMVIAESPGLSVCDIAQELGERPHHIQFHVAMLAVGKRGREKHGMGLVYSPRDMFDKRRVNLQLTEQGQRLMRHLKPLTGSKR
ncbi:MAG: hypothetical protein B0D91_13375 [Oceanospirillales bacterium LUC14_002_19_P2]|nr:MAG: hypothetical protein B0D91_13375 [Oceanospirillales bacterium LUC14_002_19_P2]